MICVSNRCGQHSDRCPTPALCGAEVESAIRADQMRRISEIDDKRPANGLYITLHSEGCGEGDDEAADREKAPSPTPYGLFVYCICAFFALVAFMALVANIDLSQLGLFINGWMAR